jgi:hypothetical protein
MAASPIGPSCATLPALNATDGLRVSLLGTPLLGDCLSEGLAQFGYSCQEFADEHLAE